MHGGLVNFVKILEDLVVDENLKDLNEITRLRLLKTAVYGAIDCKDTNFDYMLEEEVSLYKQVAELAFSLIRGNTDEVKKELILTYRRKNADYGDAFSMVVDKLGQAGYQTFILTKFLRIQSISEVLESYYEGLDDSLKDLVNYCVMTLMYLDCDEDYSDEDFNYAVALVNLYDEVEDSDDYEYCEDECFEDSYDYDDEYCEDEYYEDEYYEDDYETSDESKDLD